jgi:hypothetical protein
VTGGDDNDGTWRPPEGAATSPEPLRRAAPAASPAGGTSPPVPFSGDGCPAPWGRIPPHRTTRGRAARCPPSSCWRSSPRWSSSPSRSSWPSSRRPPTPDAADRTPSRGTETEEPATDDPGEPSEDAEDPATDLDLDALAGRDEAFGRLLTEVDASERVMIAFQRVVGEALEEAAAPDELLQLLRTAAEVGQRGRLAEVRPELVDRDRRPRRGRGPGGLPRASRRLGRLPRGGGRKPRRARASDEGAERGRCDQLQRRGLRTGVSGSTSTASTTTSVTSVSTSWIADSTAATSARTPESTEVGGGAVGAPGPARCPPGRDRRAGIRRRDGEVLGSPTQDPPCVVTPASSLVCSAVFSPPR